jgi:hypothetical protein
MNLNRVLLSFVTLLALSGCSLLPQSQPPPAALSSATAPPLSTQTPAESATPAPTAPSTPTTPPSPTPFASFKATVTVDHLNVRANPGYLFDVMASAAKGVELMVLGQAPGGEWIFIQQGSSTRGWVFAQLIKPSQDLKGIPVIEPKDVQLVKGKVVDPAGAAVSGIQFTLLQGAGASLQRNDAVTDETGVFYAFMPKDAAGQWTVAYTAVSCTSNTMDENCNCRNAVCGSAHPSETTITLPQAVTLDFTWN